MQYAIQCLLRILVQSLNKKKHQIFEVLLLLIFVWASLTSIMALFLQFFNPAFKNKIVIISEEK